MAYIGFEEFAELYEMEGSKTYLVLWTNVSNPSLENRMKTLVEAIVKGNIEGKMVDPVVFLAKSSD